MSVQKLNQNNFHNAIANGTALVDFYADWCGPCRMVSPIVDEIAEERNDITVGKVNVDDENALAMTYGVMSIPTLIVFQDGKEKTRIVGAKPKAAILAQLQEERRKERPPRPVLSRGGLLILFFPID